MFATVDHSCCVAGFVDIEKNTASADAWCRENQATFMYSINEENLEDTVDAMSKYESSLFS